MNERREITIDTKGLQDIALKGVRRANAFLGLGLKALENGPPTSVNLQSDFQFRWFPEPLPDAAAKEIATEYEAWLVGAGLKELDLFFGLFLDEVWDWLRIAEFHGQPINIAPDASFRAKTKVSKKLEAVEAKLATSSPWSAYFDGYSLARNALSHNAGVVRPRDLNEAAKLRLHWRGPDIVIKGPDKEVVLNQHGGTPLPQVFEAGGQVLFRMAEREKEFLVGEPIRLSKFDLSEICFSYQVASDVVTKGFVAHLSAKGIPTVPETS